jgi:uroporphyrinogen-III synthase
MTGKLLYLGTNQSFQLEGREIIHCPVIEILPRDIQDEKVQNWLKNVDQFTHFLITSKNTVEILFSLGVEAGLDLGRALQGKCISIGPSTTKALEKKGVAVLWEAKVSSQEGLIEEMEKFSFKDSYISYPRSSLARPLLLTYLEKTGVLHEVLDVYDTVTAQLNTVPSLSEVGEIFFTSPSTVESFFTIYPEGPKDIKCSFQGPVTKAAFLQKMKDCNY